MTAITSMVHRPARQHLLRVALALSLVLNLCFIGGAAWIRMHAPPHPGIAKRFRQVEAGLTLDPRQEQAFDRYTATIEARVQLMHRRMRPLFDKAWGEMAKPQATAADVMRIFDQAQAERHSFQRDLATDTLAFLSRLSPAQRQKFVELVHRRAARRHPPH